MRIKTMSSEELEKICKEHGIPMADKDDPIYREGVSVMFLHRTSKYKDKASTEIALEPPQKKNERR